MSGPTTKWVSIVCYSVDCVDCYKFATITVFILLEYKQYFLRTMPVNNKRIQSGLFSSRDLYCWLFFFSWTLNFVHVFCYTRTSAATRWVSAPARTPSICARGLPVGATACSWTLRARASSGSCRTGARSAASVGRHLQSFLTTRPTDSRLRLRSVPTNIVLHIESAVLFSCSVCIRTPALCLCSCSGGSARWAAGRASSSAAPRRSISSWWAASRVRARASRTVWWASTCVWATTSQSHCSLTSPGPGAELRAMSRCRCRSLSCAFRRLSRSLPDSRRLVPSSPQLPALPHYSAGSRHPLLINASFQHFLFVLRDKYCTRL